MFYPSIAIADSEVRDALYLGGLKVQTGQWVHDLLSVGRVVNCGDGMGATIIWRWDDESFLSFNARFKNFVDRFGYRKPKESKPLAPITDQQTLFGDLPVPSSPSPIGEITAFKNTAKRYFKNTTKVGIAAHAAFMVAHGRPWMELHGYGFNGRAVYLLPQIGRHSDRSGCFAIRGGGGLLNSSVGEGYQNPKIAAYNFQKN